MTPEEAANFVARRPRAAARIAAQEARPSLKAQIAALTMENQRLLRKLERIIEVAKS